MEAKADVPDWMVRKAEEYIKLLGIDTGIEISLSVADVVGGDERTLGGTLVNFRYWSATVTLRRDTKNDRAGRLLMMHEFCHVMQMEVFQAKARIIELVPKELQDHAEDLFHDGNEHLTERLSKVLINKLEGPEKPKKAAITVAAIAVRETSEEVA